MESSGKNQDIAAQVRQRAAELLPDGADTARPAVQITPEFVGQCRDANERGDGVLYAHLNRFAPKLAAGDKVERGQKIGEVGKTGWATGPHLHFEFLLNGEQVDPQLVIPPPPPPLDTAEQARFDQFRDAFLSSVSGVQVVGASRFE